MALRERGTVQRWEGDNIIMKQVRTGVEKRGNEQQEKY